MNDGIWTLSSLEDEVFNIIKIEKKLDDSFEPDTPLESIGLDSLALVRILVAIDQLTGVWLEGDALSSDNLKDSKSVAKLVYESLETSATPA